MNATNPHILTGENFYTVTCDVHPSWNQLYVWGYDYVGDAKYPFPYKPNEIFSAGNECLFHHSECKGTPNSYEGKWEIRKVIAVSKNSLTLDKAPDVDLNNYHVQIVPVFAYKKLLLLQGAAILGVDGQWHKTQDLPEWNGSPSDFITHDSEEPYPEETYYSQIDPTSGRERYFCKTISGEIIETFKDTYVVKSEAEGYFANRLTCPPYSYKNHCGGILAIKVSDTLTFMGGYIDVPDSMDNLFLFAKNIVGSSGIRHYTDYELWE